MSNLNLQKLREWVWPWPWTFNPGSQAGQYLIYLTWKDGRLSWPWCWLYIKMVYLSTDSWQWPIREINDNLTIISPTF